MGGREAERVFQVPIIWGKMMAFTKAVVEKWKTDIRLFKSAVDRALGMWGQGDKGGKSQAQDSNGHRGC